MQVGVNALEAVGDPGCLPLDEGVRDLVSLFFLQVEETGGSMFRDELQGLEHSGSGFFGRKFWELLLDLPKGLGIGFGFGIKLMVVPILAGPVFPDAASQVLELLNVWSVELALGINARQRCTAPTVLLVVPEMAEGGLMVDLCVLINGWYPHKGNEVGTKVFVEGLKAPRAVGYHG